MPIENLSKVWPEWTVEETIGGGGNGSVYRAVRTEYGISVRSAIKVITVPTDQMLMDLRAEGMSDEEIHHFLHSAVKNLVEEIRIMESLRGLPNIVSIEDYRVCDADDRPGWDIFIRMELLTPLTRYLDPKKPSEQEVIRMACEICSALELMNERGIIHRDIKPENVLVNEFGTFKLGDFGTARVIESSSLSLTQNTGSPPYMAPEISLGRHYDSRADIYSTGIMLYRLMNNNRLPFLDPDKQLLTMEERNEAKARRMRGEPLPPPKNSSPALTEIILKASEFRPEKRYADITELKNALEALNQPKTAAPGKKKLLAAVSGTLAGLLLIGGSIALVPKLMKDPADDVLPGYDDTAALSDNPETGTTPDVSGTEDGTADNPYIVSGQHKARLVRYYNNDYFDTVQNFGRNWYNNSIYWLFKIDFSSQQKIHIIGVSSTWADDIKEAERSAAYEFDDTRKYYVADAWDKSVEGNSTWFELPYNYYSTECFVSLPDNPDIAGDQSITIQYALDETIYQETIPVGLEYNGSYRTGYGWKQTGAAELTDVILCSRQNSDGSIGTNVNGNDVKWTLVFDFSSFDSMEAVHCSWTDGITDITDKTYVGGAYEDSGWPEAKAGMTLFEAGIDFYGTYSGSFLLPDDPSIAGRQWISVEWWSGDILYLQAIHFDLTYIGNYSDSRGWRMDNIEYGEPTPVEPPEIAVPMESEIISEEPYEAPEEIVFPAALYFPKEDAASRISLRKSENDGTDRPAWLLLIEPIMSADCEITGVICSWGDAERCDTPDGPDEWLVPGAWEAASEGRTLWQTLYVTTTTPAKNLVQIALPDDPSAAGDHLIIIESDGIAEMYEVSLTYSGDYETGSGWSLD